MRKFVSKRWHIGLLFLLGVGLSLFGHAFKTRDYHPQNTECNSCHLPSQVTKENAHQLVDSQEKLCVRCHANALQVSHPTGFAPAQKPPTSFPVDWKGDVTCSTCHQVHGHEHGLLRGGKNGREFCLGCHKESFFSSMADKGASIQLTGHLAKTSVAENIDLDPYSRQCLTCHAESGDGLATGVDQRGIVRHGRGSGNHPIGMRYGETRGIGLYRKVTELPKAIMLPQGKVGCVSCHIGYSKNHGALVMSNDRSALCMGCHDI